jgi:GNAT superfamily N-acetyltransferase
MLIRTATELDWPSSWPFWREIVAAGDTYTYEPITDSEQARELWFGSGSYQTWVCTIDDSDESESDEPGSPAPTDDAGRIVGTYHLGPNHGGAGSHIANGSYMVAPGIRGHGIGRAMVEHSIRRATESGYLESSSMRLRPATRTRSGCMSISDSTSSDGFPADFGIPNSG